MPSPARLVRQIAARFAPSVRRSVQCSSCARPSTAPGQMISGPAAYLCEGCIEQAARQLAPRQRPLDGVRCAFCNQVRDKHDVTAVGTVTVCAECLGVMMNILADNGTAV